MPTGDIAGWHQVFTDDFGTNVPLGSFPAAVSNKWYAYPSPWTDTSGNGTYDPQKVVSIHDGEMDLWLHSENGVHYVAAPVPIVQPGTHSYGSGQLYGRYTVCFKADSIPGYKTAWLLWPNSDSWPTDGEIDFPEGSLTGSVAAYMHWQGGTSGSSQDAYETSVPEAGPWHVATVEWTRTACRFTLDGNVIGTSTDAADIPATAMHWVLQTETQGSTPPTDTAAGHVLIDWVAAYVPA